MSAPAAVVLCRCGHGTRMHERDDAEPDGRGACMQRQCGCSGLRPGEIAAVSPVAEPAASEPVEKPEPTAPYHCVAHGLDFPNGQAFGAHNRHHHPKPPAAAKQGSPGQHGSSAAVSSVRPDNGEGLAPSGTATQGRSAAAVGDAPNGTAGPHARPVALARYSLHVVFVLANGAGTVDFRMHDATEAELFAWLPFVTNLPTEGATTA